MKSSFVLVCLSIVCCGSLVEDAGAKTKVPEWLTQAAKAPNPKFDKEDRPDAVVLWDEAVYEFLEDGTQLSTIRFAIRIVAPGGRARARAASYYREGSVKINRLKAWNIDREGEVYAYKYSDISDVTAMGSSLYSEDRAKIIDGKSKSRVGSVFGFEYTKEEKTIFSQHNWRFQADIPVIRSRLEIVVPSGWSVRDTRFHGAPEAIRVGDVYIWDMTDLDKFESEPSAPYRSVERAFITVDVKAPAEAEVRHSTLSFSSWEDISNYTAETQDPQMNPSPEIEAKALELTKDAGDVWGRVRAIGDYVKDLRYASINMDLSSGGGYTPREASEVFRVGYGDCKDKANLLRSMLQVVGIRAYPVVVNASNNDVVYPKWPSTFYFNHCIAAVEVDDSVDSPAVIEDEDLGRLLFVDATSSLTPIGELPFTEQGGLTVIGKRGLDRLVRLPQAPPEENLTTREIKAELLPNGGMIGLVSDRYHGKKANEERRLRLQNDEKEYKGIYERWIGDGNASSRVELRKVEDNEATDRSFEVELEFAISGYAKSMRNQLLIFKPAILSRREGHPFTESSRTLPIRIKPSLLEEQAMIYIPIGFEVDDMKESIEVETEFASYSVTLEQVEDKLMYKRSLRFNDMVVPAENYSEVQDFYRSVIEADQTPVVLVRVKG